MFDQKFFKMGDTRPQAEKVVLVFLQVRWVVFLDGEDVREVYERDVERAQRVCIINFPRPPG